jgi:hypothetical protein
MKILGLHWDQSLDRFAYYISLHPSQYTKWKVLSIIARLFDRIVFLGSTLLWNKMFIQELWKLDGNYGNFTSRRCTLYMGLICKRTTNTWHNYASSTYDIYSRIDINSHTEIQFVGFSDVSQNGYVTNVYLREKVFQMWPIFILLVATRRSLLLRPLNLTYYCPYHN